MVEHLLLPRDGRLALRLNFITGEILLADKSQRAGPDHADGLCDIVKLNRLALDPILPLPNAGGFALQHRQLTRFVARLFAVVQLGVHRVGFHIQRFRVVFLAMRHTHVTRGDQSIRFGPA